MKTILSFFAICCLLAGCKNKSLSSDDITEIVVVRNTTEQQNKQQENTPAQQNNWQANAPVQPFATSASCPTSPNTPATRYHIIVGSFSYSQKAKADYLVEQLRLREYPATIINSANRYRVSIENFATEAEATAARDEYRAITDRQDIWIHKIN
ncbi:MAG: SPOR domain-containing protein [Odoribacter sp.]|nr:SPOR domain-containing protein [Odoribacter sp.]